MKGGHLDVGLKRGFTRTKIYARSRLLAVSDLARLNVGSRAHLSFADGKVERPLHILHRILNTCLLGCASRSPPRARGASGWARPILLKNSSTVMQSTFFECLNP